VYYFEMRRRGGRMMLTSGRGGMGKRKSRWLGKWIGSVE
jgi:hypothetical protein